MKEISLKLTIPSNIDESDISSLSKDIERAICECTAKYKKEKKEKFTKGDYNPDDFEWVDLGLPSGKLWAKDNAPDYYTYDEAREVFGRDLPKAVSIAELVEECEWEWDSDKKGYKVVGPNGNSIFMPASGYRGSTSGGLSRVGGGGYYWSCASNSQAYAYRLYFSSSYLYPLNSSYRAYGFSVRPCRELS